MNKGLLRWGIYLVLAALLLISSAWSVKDRLARWYAEKQIRKRTGFHATVGKMAVGVIEPRVRVESLLIHNPPRFGGDPFLDAIEIAVEYAPAERRSRRVRIKSLRATVRELNIVTGGGRTNVTEFLSKSMDHIGQVNTSSVRGGEIGFSGIDLLEVRLGTIRYTDLDRPKRNQSIDLRLENHVLRGVRSVEDFSGVLLNLLFREGFTLYLEEPLPE